MSKKKDDKKLVADIEQFLEQIDLKNLDKERDEIYNFLYRVLEWQKKILVENEVLYKEQKAMKVARQRYHEFYNLSPVSEFTINNISIIKELNFATAELLGGAVKDLQSQSLHDFVVDESRDDFFQFLKTLFASNTQQHVEINIITPEGKKKRVKLQAVRYYDIMQKIRLAKVVATDISEVKATKVLAEVREKLRLFIQNSFDGIIVTDEQGIIIEWNKEQEHLTGIKSDEALGQNYYDLQYHLLPKNYQTATLYESLKQGVKQLLKTGESEWKGRRVKTVYHNGSDTYYVQVLVFPIKTEKGFLIGSITRNISQDLKS